MCTSLTQASLPPTFWVEAILSIAHTFNHLPTTTLHLKTPFEILFGISLTYEHLCVFGCLCYPNLSSTATYKLSPRSSACVYLGPSVDHRGYRCTKLITQKVILSRHVTFDETHFPYPEFHHSPTSNDYDFFLLDDDPLTMPTFSPPTVTSNPPSSTSTEDSPSPSPPSPTNDSLTSDTTTSSPTPPPSSHPMVTRSHTGSLRPQQIFNVYINSDVSLIPLSTTQDK